MNPLLHLKADLSWLPSALQIAENKMGGDWALLVECSDRASLLQANRHNTSARHFHICETSEQRRPQNWEPCYDRITIERLEDFDAVPQWIPPAPIGSTGVAPVPIDVPPMVPAPEPPSMLIVLPYSAADAGAMQDLIKWIGELGGCEYYDALLVEDSGVPLACAAGIHAAAAKTFRNVDHLITRGLDGLKWPGASTVMFIRAARHILETNPRHFFWMEADCVALHPHWANTLEQRYVSGGRKFMGCVVELASTVTPKHLTGCAVYPADAIRYVEHLEHEAEHGAWVAWDLAAADKIIPETLNTDLIQHSWGLWKEPPTFVVERQWFEPNYVKTLASISPSAAVFHRCKDGSLTRQLRKRFHADTH